MKGISVILPIYNGADMVEDCLRSIFLAGSRVEEIIIVDDGSTDETFAVVQRLAETDKRLKIIHTENHGSYTARITGIRAATSSYLAFIDVDDRFIPGSLDLLADLLYKTKSDIAIGSYLEVNSLEELPSTNNSGEYILRSTDDMWPRLMKWKTQEFLWYLWHKLYKKELFCDLEEAEGLCQGDDVLLSAQLFLRANTVVETKTIIYLYYQNPNSMLHSRFGDRDLDLIRVWDKVSELTAGKESPLVDGKSLYDLALFNRWRTDFTLITRLILADDRRLDQRYARDLQGWRESLRKHWKDLISPHALPRSREILIIALRFFYGPVKSLMRFGKRI